MAVDSNGNWINPDASSGGMVNNIMSGLATPYIGKLLGKITPDAGARYNNAGMAAGNAGLATIQNTYVPTPQELKISLDQAVLAGQITPQQMQDVLQADSESRNISTDPKLKAAQMSALEQLQNIGAEGGLDAQDRSKLAQIKNEQLATEQGQRGAILQGAERRGVGGSGLELAQQLESQQGAATRAGNQGMDVAAQAQARALAAIQGAGTMAGGMETSDFAKQQQVAAAQDAINRFNTSMMATKQSANVAANTRAQEMNIANQQAVINKNLEQQRAQAEANAKATESVARLEAEKARNIASQQQNQAKMFEGQATAARETSAKQTSQAGGLLSSVGGIGGLVQGGMALASMFSDENLKTDVKPFDANAFLDSITGHKYRYTKESGLPEGEQVGVMAQDMEKTPGGANMVSDTPEGKVIDYSKAGGPLFASLASINERLKKIEEGNV